MVLINDRKFACATCIKGHRVSSCVHTDRPLFEIKKKGRPATQCQFCKEKRKTESVHPKCSCGEGQVPLPLASASRGDETLQTDASSLHPDREDTETRKGIPGSTPTFPNGLRDVHEMAAAADALADLGAEGPRHPERQLRNLLNPCLCNSGGICKCCRPRSLIRKRETSLTGRSSGSRTPDSAGISVTDSLVEMFQTKATTSNTPPENSGNISPSSTDTAHASVSTLRPTRTDIAAHISPSNMHHPAHTSPHVHKTKLYSPYSTGHNTPKHGRKEASKLMDISHRLPKIRPLVDMNTFLGAVFMDDGTVASEIPRSALGLPGIKTFDTMAENGGVKVETMDMDVDSTLTFPTAEAAIVGACTCGDNCECPGCVTHGTEKTSEHSACGDECQSCFNCSEHVTFPSGVVSVQHLISIAAAKVPNNVPRRTGVQDLDPNDTRILPPSAALISDEAAKASGIVHLRPLDCCNGRCQCPPGQCSCEKDCCGCCIRCACAEDGDMVMSKPGGSADKPSSCCDPSNTNDGPSSRSVSSRSPTPYLPMMPPPSMAINTSTGSSEATPITSSNCCSIKPDESPGAQSEQGLEAPTIQAASADQPRTVSQQFSDLSMAQKTPPHPPVTKKAAPAQKAQPSNSSASNGGNNRRISVSNPSSSLQRSSSSSKSSSKALALHVVPHHPHPRPILPKVPSGSGSNRLAPSSGASGSGTRGPSPSGRIQSSSSVSSRVSTPPIPMIPPSTSEGSESNRSAISDLAIPALPSSATAPTSSKDGLDQTVNASQLNAEEQQLLAYLSQISAGGSGDIGTFMSSLPKDLETHAGSLPDSGQTSQKFDLNKMLGMFGDGEASYRQPSHPFPDFASSFNQLSNMPNHPTVTTLTSSSSTLPTMDFGQPDRPFSSSMSFPQDSFAPQNPYVLPSTSYMDFGFQLPQNMDPRLSTDNRTADSSAVPSAPNGLVDMVSSTQPAVTANFVDGSNPNLIDLSKPLNPGDVDRILRALQQQQELQKAEAYSSVIQDHQHSFRTSNPAAESDASGAISGYTSSDPSVEAPDPLSDSAFREFMFDPAILNPDNFGNGVEEFLSSTTTGTGMSQEVGFPGFDSQNPNMSWEHMKQWAAEAGGNP